MDLNVFSCISCIYLYMIENFKKDIVNYYIFNILIKYIIIQIQMTTENKILINSQSINHTKIQYS